MPDLRWGFWSKWICSHETNRQILQAWWRWIQYGNCTQKVFNRLLQRDVFVWNVVVQGYANLGPFVEALNLFDHEMRVSGAPTNRYTFPFVMKACGANKNSDKGEIVHGHILKCALDLDLSVGNDLITFYSKCTHRKFKLLVKCLMICLWYTSWVRTPWLLVILQMGKGRCYNAFFMSCCTTKLIAHLIMQLPSCDYACLCYKIWDYACLCLTKSASQVGFWVHFYNIKIGMEVGYLLGSCLISTYNCDHVNIAKDAFNWINGF